MLQTAALPYFLFSVFCIVHLTSTTTATTQTAIDGKKKQFWLLRIGWVRSNLIGRWTLPLETPSWHQRILKYLLHLQPHLSYLEPLRREPNGWSRSLPPCSGFRVGKSTYTRKWWLLKDEEYITKMMMNKLRSHCFVVLAAPPSFWYCLYVLSLFWTHYY